MESYKASDVFCILNDIKGDISRMARAKKMYSHGSNDEAIVKAYEYCEQIVSKKIEEVMK